MFHSIIIGWVHNLLHLMYSFICKIISTHCMVIIGIIIIEHEINFSSTMKTDYIRNYNILSISLCTHSSLFQDVKFCTPILHCTCPDHNTTTFVMVHLKVLVEEYIICISALNQIVNEICFHP